MSGTPTRITAPERAFLAGRSALVTGGSGAIGAAVALRLAEAGARVVIAYRSGTERAMATAEAIRRGGGAAWAARADLSEEAGCLMLMDAARARLGDVDLLIHAAGVSLLTTAFDTGTGDWRRVMDVNVTAAFVLAREAIPSMVRRGYGRVVNIGSIWGETGAAGEVAYSASKAALTGMTKALAKEVARSAVTVNVVSPGVIDTPMNDAFDPGEREALLRRIPAGRIGSPEDVAGAVAFLCSDDARYITGHVLSVTGGFDPVP